MKTSQVSRRRTYSGRLRIPILETVTIQHVVDTFNFHRLRPVLQVPALSDLCEIFLGGRSESHVQVVKVQNGSYVVDHVARSTA
jgi:hypothetical protein